MSKNSLLMNIKFFLFSAILLVSSALQAQADIENLRVIAPIPGQSISAAYLVLSNNTEESLELVSIETESADRVEIHTHRMDNGMMRMEQLESLPIDAGEQAVFERGGLHLMVFSPDAQAIQAGTIEMVFHFSDGTSVTAEARVEQLMPMNHQNHQH
jgi:hypothetical protein